MGGVEFCGHASTKLMLLRDMVLLVKNPQVYTGCYLGLLGAEMPFSREGNREPTGVSPKSRPRSQTPPLTLPGQSLLRG